MNRAKQTRHASNRVLERTKASSSVIAHKLSCGEYMGLPRQTNNKRVALIYIPESKESLVVVYSHRTMEIITVMQLSMYVERHPELLNNYTIQHLLNSEPKKETADAE